MALVPPLILLYFLKLKRPQFEVPSTLLWRKVIEDIRVNSPFQRLKRSLLLLIQLLLLLALIFALTRPTFEVRDLKRGSRIVLVDVSASMNTLEAGGETRLDQARKLVGELIDNLARDEQMMLIAFSNRAELLASFTNSKRQLRLALDRLQPTERPTDIREALALAKSLAGSGRNVRMAILSDGAFPDPGQMELPFEVEYQKLGEIQPNVAVTGLDIRRALRDPQLIEMFVAIQNFSESPRKGNMLVYLDEELLDSKFFDLDGGKSLSQIFEAKLPEGGNVRVQLDVKDGLDLDNRAWQVVLPPKPRTVMIVGARNFFLERVFQASQSIHVDSRPLADYDADEAATCTAVIWNRVDKPLVAPTNNIYLGCFPQLEGLSLGETVKSPAILDWDTAHPVNRFIDYSNLLIEEAQVVALPATAVPLVTASDNRPLIALTRSGRHPLCIVAFDPFASNWPLLVSFPIFLHNCLNHFEAQGSAAENSNLQVGRAITAPAHLEDPVIRLPSGEDVPMNRPPNGDYTFSRVDRCGPYEIRADGKVVRTIAANLFDSRESSLRPADRPLVSGTPVAAARLAEETRREYSKPLLLAALCLLLFEWFVYHRRIFV